MAQVEFFCTSEDEKSFFDYLKKDQSIEFTVVEDGQLTGWENISEINLPDYEKPLTLYLWNTGLGQIKWIKEEPKIDFSRHSKLVKSIFTREDWIEEKRKGDFDKILDGENSPVLYYTRGEVIYGYRLPNLILSPQSSLDNLGEEFKRWFNRTSSWIKRNSEMVHSWNMKNNQLRNDSSFLNTCYAMPEALNILNKDHKKYAVSINTRRFNE